MLEHPWRRCWRRREPIDDRVSRRRDVHCRIGWEDVAPRRWRCGDAAPGRDADRTSAWAISALITGSTRRVQRHAAGSPHSSTTARPARRHSTTLAT